MRSTFFSLLAVANAVLVTETDYRTFYVTVGPNAAAPTTSAEESTFNAPAPATTSSSAPAAPNFQFTTSSFEPAPSAPEVTTSSSSVAPPPPSTPTTSSTSSTPPPPPPSTTQFTSTSSSSAAPTTSAGGSPLAQDIVNYHNRVRAEHHVGPVSWSDDLANFAQNYLAGDNCVFKHSGGPHGENIAIGYATIDDALDAWYNEEDQYNYSAGQFGESTGHFTQMVWKGTTQVGCATQDCSGRTFLVCEYNPRGNIIGQFTQNVLAK